MSNIILKNAARILGISVYKLRNLVKEGRIEPTGYHGGLGGRSVTFNTKDVYALERELKNEKPKRIKIRTK